MPMRCGWAAIWSAATSPWAWIPLGLAERIKTFHGGVHATGMDDREMIELGADTGDWDKDRRRVSRTELIGIMRPRVEEILEEVRARLDAAGFEHLPSQQIVLTGGGSLIPGHRRAGARILGQRVRLGRPLRVQGLPQAVAGAHFGRRGAVPVRGAPAGRMVGFRDPGRTLPGAVACAGRCAGSRTTGDHHIRGSGTGKIPLDSASMHEVWQYLRAISCVFCVTIRHILWLAVDRMANRYNPGKVSSGRQGGGAGRPTRAGGQDNGVESHHARGAD
jgi:hypothetical protein